MKKSRGDNRSFTPKIPSPQTGPGRRSMSPQESERHFTKHASKTHYMNLRPTRVPLRGGIRL